MATSFRSTPLVAPRNGLLSGMIVTAIAAVAAIGSVLFVPGVHARFDVALPPELRFLFLVSALIMAAHQAESYWFGEYDACPVYVTSGRSLLSTNVRRVYPGFFTSLAFVGLSSFAIFPKFHAVVSGGAEHGAGYFAYYAAMPLLFIAFYLEDRLWLAREAAYASGRTPRPDDEG